MAADKTLSLGPDNLLAAYVAVSIMLKLHRPTEPALATDLEALRAKLERILPPGFVADIRLADAEWPTETDDG